MPKKETAGTKSLNESERKNETRVQKNDGIAHGNKTGGTSAKKGSAGSKKK